MFSLRTWKVMKMWLLEAEPGGDHNTDNDTVMLKPPGLGAAKILSTGSQLIHFSISSSREKQCSDTEDFSMTSFGSLKPTKSGSRQRNGRREGPHQMMLTALHRTRGNTAWLGRTTGPLSACWLLALVSSPAGFSL